MAELTGAPIQPNSRADILDVLRGFALLGICLANSANFSQYIFLSPAQTAALPTSSVDSWLSSFHFAFIDGKFYSLFSLLFGIGFAIIFFKKSEGNSSGLRFFYRRLFFLLLFGLAHSLLIWDGDILFFYAIVGALLPIFRKFSNKALIFTSIFLLLSPILIDILKVLSEGKWNVSKPFFVWATNEDASFGLTQDKLAGWLQTNDGYQDLLNWNRSGFIWGWQYRLDSNRIPKVLAMFLLGLYIGRAKLYERLNENLDLLKKIQKWSLGIGIPAGIAYAYFHFDNKSLPLAAGLWDTVFYAFNVAPLSLGYASTIALWYGDNPRKFQWLKPVGRMALTNYIGQSILGVLLYYGLGFGLGGDKGPSFFMPVAICIFIFQILYSHLWMKYFEFGPLEWIWRQLTYGKMLKIFKR